MIRIDDIDLARQWVGEDLKRMVAHGARLRGHTPPPMHYIMADFLQGARPEWIARVKAMLGFRFAAKTAFRQYCKFRWLRCPWTQIIIHSSNDNMAKKFVQAIKEELLFDPLMEHLRPEASSSDFEFNLKGVRHEQGYSIVCAGIKTSLTGSRCDFYGFDDPEPEVDPESLHDRVIQAIGEAGDILHSPRRHLHKMGWDEVPIPERLQMLVVGQPHCPTTAYIPRDEDFEIGEEGNPLINAVFLKIPVLRGDGSWMWPEMMEQKYYNWTEDRPMTVEEVRLSMPTSRWELQYMINVDFMKEAAPVLKLAEIERSFRLVQNPILVVDPADSETGCEWGLTVLGMFEHKIHVCYLGGVRGEAYEGDDWQSMGESTWRKVFDLADEFHCREVFLEANLKSAATACRRYVAKNNVRCVVNEFRVSHMKKRRIPEILEQPINNGMVSCNPTVLSDVENLRQMTKLRWDKLPNPNDRLDALSMGVGILIEEPHLWALRKHSHQRRRRRGETAGFISISRNAFERLG